MGGEFEVSKDPTKENICHTQPHTQPVPVPKKPAVQLTHGASLPPMKHAPPQPIHPYRPAETDYTVIIVGGALLVGLLLYFSEA